MKRILLLLIIFFSCGKVLALDTSAATVVMDMDSGRVLYEKNKDERRLIASITKIMTAVVAIERGNLNDKVVVGEEVLKMYGSNIYIEVGEELALRDLLYGLMLRSGNDAAVVIATYIAGDEETFVKFMNEKAQEIGMNNTVFKNCHGLDDETENYSTAYDMAKLSSYANRLMEYVVIAGTDRWSVTTNKKSYIWYNRNKLLKEYKYLTGGKTGFTPRAGKTLVTTASKDGLNLTIVSLKDPNHYDTQEELYNYIFSKYKNVLLIDKDNLELDNNIYDGLYVKSSFSYPLSDSELNFVKVYADLYNNNYENGDKVGEIYVLFNNEEIYRENIYAVKKENSRKSIFEYIRDFFNSLF